LSKLIHTIVVVFIAVAFYLVLPALLVWGWVRWGKRSHLRNVSSILSLIGFILASLSALLAVSAMLYARVIGGFPFYDPLLLTIYRVGGLLSIGGFIFGFSGAWRSNSLRWLAPACSLGMFLFWFAMATGV
jgi:hypothetical protein